MRHPSLFSVRSQRLRVGLLLITGLFATVSMRLDLSMAVTCMVNSTAFENPVNANTSITTGTSKCQREVDGQDLAQLGYNVRVFFASKSSGNPDVVSRNAIFSLLSNLLWKLCHASHFRSNFAIIDPVFQATPQIDWGPSCCFWQRFSTTQQCHS